jgi:23S rRNA pseudouridine1911/1915/1917 synthase
LTRQFSAGEVAKTYWAIVEREPQPAAATIADWLFHDDNRRRVVVVPEGTEGAKRAELTYRTIRELPVGWLVEVEPATGRKHHIRVQLAARELPVLGDKKYGSRCPWSGGMALHARSLQLKHPVGGQPLTFTAPVPEMWRTTGV